MNFNFLDANTFNGIATLITAAVAILLYYWEQRKKKRDVAKIIVQEIRRAEDIINEYKEHGSYKFTRKIIATNSWANSIHHFVGDLAQDAVDKISNLYSTGEYLDTIITKVSDYNFDEQAEKYKNDIKIIFTELQNNHQSTGGDIKSGSQIVSSAPQLAVPIEIKIPPPWKKLLDEISYKYQPIYDSDIVRILKKIAKIK